MCNARLLTVSSKPVNLKLQPDGVRSPGARELVHEADARDHVRWLDRRADHAQHVVVPVPAVRELVHEADARDLVRWLDRCSDHAHQEVVPVLVVLSPDAGLQMELEEALGEDCRLDGA